MNEAEFTFRVRQALNEGAERVNYKTSLRLERARRFAVDRARGVAVAPPATVRLPALQVAVVGGASLDAPPAGGLWAWLRRAGLAAPLLVLGIGFVSIYHWHDQKFISELADVDFAVLLDENPISAYADKGFGALLRQPEIAVVAEEERAAAAAGSARLTTIDTAGAETAEVPDPASAAAATDAPSADTAQ